MLQSLGEFLKFLLQRYISPRWLKWSLISAFVLMVLGVGTGIYEDHLRHRPLMGEVFWRDAPKIMGYCFMIPFMIFGIIMMFRILFDLRRYGLDAVLSLAADPAHVSLELEPGEKVIQDLNNIFVLPGKKMPVMARMVITTANIYFICRMQILLDMQKGVGVLKPYWVPGMFRIPLTEVSDLFQENSSKKYNAATLYFKNGEHLPLKLHQEVKIPKRTARPV